MTAKLKREAKRLIKLKEVMDKTEKGHTESEKKFKDWWKAKDDYYDNIDKMIECIKGFLGHG